MTPKAMKVNSSHSNRAHTERACGSAAKHGNLLGRKSFAQPTSVCSYIDHRNGRAILQTRDQLKQECGCRFATQRDNTCVLRVGFIDAVSSHATEIQFLVVCPNSQ